jgi:negative regulator of genetic competence, sporulation and motility
MEKTLDEQIKDWSPIFYEKEFNKQIDKAAYIYRIERNQITLDLMKVTGRHFVYVLEKNQKVIYVGRSSNLYSRLVSHKSKKDFNVIMLYEYTDKGQCRDCEYFGIKHYKPMLNKIWVTKGLNKYDTIQDI